MCRACFGNLENRASNEIIVEASMQYRKLHVQEEIALAAPLSCFGAWSRPPTAVTKA